jgi:hypothetical protein
MSPADWNWADFNGSLLLLIYFRHAHRLEDLMRGRIREAIRHAAISVRRRNVSMTYTNIAVQGTFVLLAAANVLRDAELRDYAVKRLHRFEATVNETGSFAEYNSPTYANVTIANLTRMRMFTPDADVLPVITALHERVWLHLGKHWHATTAQLAGPMSRCYSTDIGTPLWIQKALGGRLVFASLEQARKSGVNGEVAMLDYLCPEKVAPLFLEAPQPHLHREYFLPAKAPAEPVQGATWIESAFTLGSISRGDFWVQRRPLLAFWGDRSRPAHAQFAQLRFLKDDYDFSSALFASVQDESRVLALVNFRSPGGDKHITLDPIPDGKFKASRLRLRLDVAGQVTNVQVKGATASFWAGSRNFAIRAISAIWGDQDRATWHVDHEDGMLTLSLDLVQPRTSVPVNLNEIGTASISLALAMQSGGAVDLSEASELRVKGATELHWGSLQLSGLTGVHRVEEHDAATQARIDGKPVPVTRLGS